MRYESIPHEVEEDYAVRDGWEILVLKEKELETSYRKV